MVQWLNLRAVVRAADVLLCRRSLAVPHIRAQSINDIDFWALQDTHGITGVVFDKDNCITLPYAPQIHPDIQEGWERCLAVFGPERMAVFSNSAGSSDDAGFAEAKSLTRSLGVPVVEHNTKKPHGLAELAAHFRSPPETLAMVGDRVLTDVVFGNLGGMLTVLVAPFDVHKDNPVVQVARRLENRFLEHLLHRGQPPPPRQPADA